MPIHFPHRLFPGTRPGSPRRAWPALLAAAIAGLLFALGTPAQAQSTPSGKLSIETDAGPGTVVLNWIGPVASPMAQLIESAFREHKQRTSRVVFKISSGGGSVAEGERVIEVLRQIRSTHPLETVVEQGRTCGSMCVFIYLQGQTRTAALSSLWLFHEVSHSDPVTKKIVRLDRAAWEKLVTRYYGPAGVSAEWTEKMKPLTIDSDYWQTGADLINANSGIVHLGLGNQKERLIADRPRPAQPRASEHPTPPRVADLPKPQRPPGEPPPATPSPQATPVDPPKRVAIQFETKECRRLHPEHNVYVNVPCSTGALSQ